MTDLKRKEDKMLVALALFTKIMDWELDADTDTATLRKEMPRIVHLLGIEQEYTAYEADWLQSPERRGALH